jgi:hypothetical protein
MRRSTLSLYAPFIALALVQAAFVVIAPSRGEQQVNAGGSNTAFPSGQGFGGGETAQGPGGTTAGGVAIDPATGAPIAGGGPGGAGGVAGAGGALVGTIDGAPPGDTRHCRNGRQTDVIFNAPPCAPRFAGNNGGNVYPGVTEKEIKLVYFECQPNEQVNAILATQGLAASKEQTDAMIQATVDFMNKTYEFYGRKLVWEHVIGNCPLTPPDDAKSAQAANEVAKKRPAFVIHYASGPASHDVWTRNGIISVGGPNLDSPIYNARRPFRWDVFPSGSQGADYVSEYYCKKLAAKNASNAGPVIHTSIGGRNTPRKVGLIVPDNGNNASVPNARRAQAAIKACTGGKENPPIFTYQSDINRAQEQTRVTVAGLINAKVTSVVCMCDAIAPVFLTSGMTQNSYFPEHVLPSANLLDYDVLGRLYDPAQWAHAFGPSQLQTPVPFSQSDAAKIWRASGRPGEPCASCNLVTGYVNFIGGMIQGAGPGFSPLAVEAAYVGQRYSRGGWVESKGDPTVYLIRFGPEDYHAISDYREVYWDGTARSEIDGKNGAYVPMNGGKRYASGELGRDFNVPPR